jgi:predicted acylesterase/phospholipase RssA
MFSLFDIFQKMGIFDKKIIEDSLYPLFNAMDVPHDINMKDFYEITKIDLHIYVTELNSFTLYDINHNDHPEWKLVDAVYASCAVPILFKPLIENEKCFVDGGMIANYPVDQCIKVAEHPNEILAVCKKKGQNNSKITNPFVENSKFLDFLLTVFSRSFEKIITNPYNFILKHQYMIDIPDITLYDIINVSSSKEERMRLIDIAASYCNNEEPVDV